MIGLIAGFCMAGLLIGALSGSLLLFLGFSAVGLTIAGIAEIVDRNKNINNKYSHYPPYGY